MYSETLMIRSARTAKILWIRQISELTEMKKKKADKHYKMKSHFFCKKKVIENNRWCWIAYCGSLQRQVPCSQTCAQYSAFQCHHRCTWQSCGRCSRHRQSTIEAKAGAGVGSLSSPSSPTCSLFVTSSCRSAYDVSTPASILEYSTKPSPSPSPESVIWAHIEAVSRLLLPAGITNYPNETPWAV